MKSEEELEALVSQMAADNTIGLDDWPDVLEWMLKRLDWIAYNTFPLPKPPPLLAPRPPISISRESTVLVQPPEEQDSQGPPNSVAETATENRDSSQNPEATADGPTVDVEATQPDSTVQVPASSQDPATNSIPSTQSTTIPSTQIISESASTNCNSIANNAGADSEEKFLPPALLTSLNTLTTLLNGSFTSAPPHTIQRFAELLLKPTKHYRSLAKFLRACHRVVCVTSGIDKFPLPISHDGTHPASNAIPIGSGLVNDNEEATGATLTPIPWASAREYVANQNGDAAGSPVSDEGVAALIADDGAGISQGELLRKEQEAGVVSMAQDGGANAEGGMLVRGPPEIGAADLGPQPEGMVFGEKPTVDGAGEEEKGDAMDVDEKVEDKTGGDEGKDS
ncbi:hypothetical protein H072_9381 [Dactylellina haptotyla CBS 200.50]|uniref:Uncharacterized protein n=1 Tax=Dactylellina haptotyla (strain CBS 200.50) TaxID=1284197 RepID=S8BP93_DACHA|nr:hypothetical protein H072_9381 [Dactylellina haptotyla CBS 200.50]